MSTVVESVDVAVPVRTAYNQWTQFEEFPRFMDGVEEIRQVTPEMTLSRELQQLRDAGVIEQRERHVRGSLLIGFVDEDVNREPDAVLRLLVLRNDVL